MKKLIPLFLVIAVLLSACVTNKMPEHSTDIFSDKAAADKLNGSWLFLPEKAVIESELASADELRVSFTGCEAPEINEYAEDVFNVLYNDGEGFVYNAMLAHDYTRMEAFKLNEITKDHIGTAYAYYYILENRVYFLDIKYYGCGNGKYGNGKTKISITDVTEVLSFLLEE